MTSADHQLNHDGIQAAYWWFAEHHEGQNSRGYRALCRLGKVYRPARSESGPDTEESARLYDEMCASNGCTHGEFGDPKPVIVGTLGDASPVEYGGGLILSRPGCAHLIGGEASIEYTHGQEAEWVDGHVGAIEVYQVEIPTDVAEEFDWVDFPALARSIEMDQAELEGYARSEDVQARASVVEAIGSHYGWHEMDSYPLQLRPAELERRWTLACALCGRTSCGAPGSCKR